jgi:hypothetical protein
VKSFIARQIGTFSVRFLSGHEGIAPPSRARHQRVVDKRMSKRRTVKWSQKLPAFDELLERR